MKKTPTKQRYKVTNWSNYNQSLINRGDITLWLSDDFLAQWYEDSHHGGRGLSNHYSHIAIECLLTLKAVFKMPLRALQGFAQSLVRLMNTDIKIPNYSTLSRRAAHLPIALKARAAEGKRVIVVDSTGIKVYGQGEWHARKHGVKQRRTWRKLHIAVDAETQEVVAAVVTTNDVGDTEVFDDLMDQIEGEIDSVAADGAYDAEGVYKTLDARNAHALIPPRKGAIIKKHGNCKGAPYSRDENIRGVRRMGRKKWKTSMGYHVRSLSETAMYRVKQLFGGSLSCRSFNNQCAELFIKLAAMNTMTKLGMPESYMAD
jgi:hypothetical protein